MGSGRRRTCFQICFPFLRFISQSSVKWEVVFIFFNKVLLSLCNIGFFHFLDLLLLLFCVCITFLFSLFCAFCLNTFRCYEQRQKTKAVFFFFSGYTKLPGFSTYTTPVVCLFSFLGVHSSFFFFCVCVCVTVRGTHRVSSCFFAHNSLFKTQARHNCHSNRVSFFFFRLTRSSSSFISEVSDRNAWSRQGGEKKKEPPSGKETVCLDGIFL